MTNVSREIQSSEGGSREYARSLRETIARERRRLRIERSHDRDSSRRVRRADGPIDTIDHDVLQAIELVRSSLSEQQTLVPAISDVNMIHNRETVDQTVLI